MQNCGESFIPFLQCRCHSLLPGSYWHHSHHLLQVKEEIIKEHLLLGYDLWLGVLQQYISYDRALIQVLQTLFNLHHPLVDKMNYCNSSVPCSTLTACDQEQFPLLIRLGFGLTAKMCCWAAWLRVPKQREWGVWLSVLWSGSSVVTLLTYGTAAVVGVLLEQLDDLGLLSGRAAAAHHRRALARQLHKLMLVVPQTHLQRGDKTRAHQPSLRSQSQV